MHVVSRLVQSPMRFASRPAAVIFQEADLRTNFAVFHPVQTLNFERALLETTSAQRVVQVLYRKGREPFAIVKIPVSFLQCKQQPKPIPQPQFQYRLDYSKEVIDWLSVALSQHAYSVAQHWINSDALQTVRAQTI